MERFILTESQNEAIGFNRHSSVTANAGTGKTFVLIRRFVNILLNTDTQVKEVVAITFTEKAASELRKKISEYLEERILTPTGNEELIKLERIRDQMISANIGTIHGFCAQLLREYPIEADIDAAFSVLDGVDKQITEQDSIHDTFESILSDSSNIKLNESFKKLVRLLGRSNLENFLHNFLEKREKIDFIVNQSSIISQSENDEEIIRKWNEILVSEVIGYLNLPLFRNSMSKVIDFANGKTADEVKELFDLWNQKLTSIENIKLYSQVAEKIFTKTHSIRKDFIGSKSDTSLIHNEINTITKIHNNISEFLDIFLSNQQEIGNRNLLKSLKCLLNVFQLVIQRYDEKKNEYGNIDFEDILLKTKVLLSQNDVREALTARYKFIMVDEFQDTNRLQYEILQSLVSNFKYGNLFIVGDPKQSIYGFRDAEVEIFDLAKNKIIDTGGGKEIILTESYRLLPNIIDFVNRVFSKIMLSSDSRYDVDYDPLIQGRNNSAEGTVGLLLSKETGNPPDEYQNNAIVEECRVIGKHILRLVKEKFIVYQKKNEQPKSIEFKDIAILLRKRSHLNTLEKVLTELKIPFVITGGMGFYQTQEVYDFINYFKFLLNIDDDIALVGILRSPFFLISDRELFEISLYENEIFWEKVKYYSTTADSTNEVRRAVKILSKHIMLSGRLSVSLLINEIFLSTSWTGTVRGLESGDQNVANIQKFLEIARDFEENGYTTLYDFVKRLRMLIENEEREGQATLDVIGNCVQVLTIHAVKGLEFPVVFIPFIHEKFRFDNSPYIDSEVGIAFHLKDENNLDEDVTPSIIRHFKKQSRSRTIAEEKRIFYVACTRARDALFLSGRLDENKLENTYLGWLFDSLDLNIESLNESRIALPPVPFKVLQVIDDKPSISTISHLLHVDILGVDGSVGEEFISQRESNLIVNPQNIYTSTVVPKHKGEYYSATHIRTYIECPAKYFLKYILGLTEINSIHHNFDEQDGTTDSLRGDIEGNLTHAVLRDVDNCNIAEDEVKKIINKHLNANWVSSSVDNNKTTEIIFNNVMMFLKSKVGREIFSAVEYKNEYTFDMVFGDDYLTGIIDKMYKDSSGNWNIVDYKTDRIELSEIDERVKIYQPQFLFYALQLSLFYNQKDVKALIIFLRLPDNPVDIKFSAVELSDFRKTLQEIINNIKGGYFSKNLPECTNCFLSNRNTCPLKY